jgi:TorA maturation chaperone TorD
LSAVAPAVAMHRALPPEEAARGNFYALLGRLFRAPPDAALLAALGSAEPLCAGEDVAIAAAWRTLVDASSAMDADAAALEYEALFDGVGKAEISLYAGFYSGAPSISHPRVRLQADLAALGLARREQVSEPEDHLAGLFEAMRVLVAGGAGREPASLAEQKRFFESHLQPSAAGFLEAVGASPKANYYRTVAALGAAFVSLESDSFQLA